MCYFIFYTANEYSCLLFSLNMKCGSYKVIIGFSSLWHLKSAHTCRRSSSGLLVREQRCPMLDCLVFAASPNSGLKRDPSHNDGTHTETLSSCADYNFVVRPERLVHCWSIADFHRVWSLCFIGHRCNSGFFYSRDWVRCCVRRAVLKEVVNASLLVVHIRY